MVSTALSTPTATGLVSPPDTPKHSLWGDRQKREPVGETKSKGQGIGKDPEDAEDPLPLPLSLVPAQSWGVGLAGKEISEGHLPDARKHPPRPSSPWPTWLLCVSIIRGPVGNLSVLVAAWGSPLGKVLKIHSIVVCY